MSDQLLTKKTKHAIEKACFDALTPKVQQLLRTALDQGETPEHIEKTTQATLIKYTVLPAKAASISNQYLQAAHYLKRVGQAAASGSASDHPETQPGHAL